jgi:uncharacterized membrane protein YqjE
MKGTRLGTERLFRMSTRELDPVESNQSISALWHQLTAQLSTLLRQELTLARTELFESLTRLLSSVGAVVVGVAFLYVALLSLLVAAIFGLALLMPIWAAALGIGVVTAVIGFVLLQRGRKLLKTSHLAPSHSPESLRKDKDVLLRRTHQ